jgi:ABC-2 type transport system ATP-binding protein
MDSVFSAASVSHRYGKRVALDELTFSCAGRSIGLLGPNGAGKTTLLSIATGMIKPTQGWVRLGESTQNTRSRAELKSLQSRLGVLPQGLQIFGAYTCGEFLRYVAWLRRVPVGEIEGNVDRALAETDLESQRRTQVRRLSGGMKQRLGLAQALVNRPSVIVFDEPTVGLDPHQRAEFRDLLVDLQERALVVLATHLVEDVAAVCDRVVVLHLGKVAFVGSTLELAQRGGATAVSGDALEAGYLKVTLGGR